MADKKFVADSEVRNQAKRINSMSATLNKLENKVEGQQQIVSTTNKVLGKLAGAVEAATSSIEKVASNAVRYTKETLDQYSKQIGQDISVNKKNLMALSITQASPVFGYFVSKFFETEAFQNTMKKIKDGFITAIRSVVDKLRGIITGTWGGLKRVVGLKKKESFDEKIPKMAKGGYVSKGGLTRLHAAEVVMPIDKLLDRIDEKYEDKFNTMFKKFNIQQTDRVSKSVQKLDTSNRVYNREILESLVEIRIALAGYTKGFREWISSMFQDFLLKHPALRFVYSMSSWFIGRARGLINFPFTRRGGYKKFLSKDPNAFNATRDILNTTFVFSMDKYDTIIQLLTQQLTATQDMASAFTGKKYKTALHKTYPEYTIAGAFMRLLGRGAKGIGKIAAWEYRGVKKMFGKGGKTGAHLPSQEISLLNITDRFATLIDIQMKMLYQIEILVKQSVNKDVYEIYMNREKEFQKKLLKGSYIQQEDNRKNTTILKSVKKDLSSVRKNISESPYAQKALKFLKHIKDSIFDLGIKFKNYVKRAGSYIWDAIKWLGGSLVGLLTTAWGLIPDPVKAALGTGIALYVGNKIGEKLNEYFPKIIDSIKATLGGGGKKKAFEFEEEDKKRREKRLEAYEKASLVERMKMSESWGLLGEMYSNVFGKEFEAKFGVPGQKITATEKLITSAQLMASKPLKLFGYDRETWLRNQVEQTREAHRNVAEETGSIYLKNKKKHMSGEAFKLLDPNNPVGVADRFLYLQQTGQIIQNKHKKWVLKDEYFEVEAPLLTKLEVGAFEKIGLGAQIKEARIHGLKAEEARDVQNKAFAETIKKNLTPEAYSMLTRFGKDNISEKFSSMVANNQLYEYQGKISTAYQVLDKTGKLSFEDRLKYMFGARNIPPSDLINLLGIKASVYKEEAEHVMNDRVNRELTMLHDPTMRYSDVLEKQAGAYSYADMMQSAEQDKSTQDYLKSIKRENQPFSSQLSEIGENFWGSFKENTSEMKEQITPVIENSKIIGMEIKKEIIKNNGIKNTIDAVLKNKHKNDEQYREDLLKAKENFNRIVHGSNIGNRNEIINVIKNNLNNSTSTVSGGNSPISTTTDPIIESILKGDLY